MKLTPPTEMAAKRGPSMTSCATQAYAHASCCVSMSPTWERQPSTARRADVIPAGCRRAMLQQDADLNRGLRIRNWVARGACLSKNGCSWPHRSQRIHHVAPQVTVCIRRDAQYPCTQQRASCQHAA